MFRVIILAMCLFLSGCYPAVKCLTPEKKFYQRHWYDEKRCVKRKRADVWLREKRMQGGLIAPKGATGE